jgi:hypothetical protein
VCAAVCCAFLCLFLSPHPASTCCCRDRAEQEKAERAERQAAIRQQLAELADELKEAQAAAREAAKAAREVARENQGVLKQVAAAEGSIKQAEQEVEEVSAATGGAAVEIVMTLWFELARGGPCQPVCSRSGIPSVPVRTAGTCWLVCFVVCMVVPWAAASNSATAERFGCLQEKGRSAKT